MSETEDDFDDEDLSAPPRRTHIPIRPSAKTEQEADGDETQDEEEDVQELSPSQFRKEGLMRKQETPATEKPKTNYAAIVRRSPNDSKYAVFCSWC